MLPNSKSIKNTAQIRIRYADTDKMGFVYNGNYLAFFEVGRAELMRAHGYPYIELEQAGYVLPLVEAHVNFKKPAKYDDLIDVVATLKLENIGATIRFDYLVLLDGIPVADGYTIHSFLKEDIMRPVKPPKFFLDKLNSIFENNQ